MNYSKIIIITIISWPIYNIPTYSVCDRAPYYYNIENYNNTI